MKRFVSMMLAMLLAGAVACGGSQKEEQGPMESAGEETGEALDEVGDETGDAVEEGTDEMEEMGDEMDPDDTGEEGEDDDF